MPIADITKAHPTDNAPFGIISLTDSGKTANTAPPATGPKVAPIIHENDHADNAENTAANVHSLTFSRFDIAHDAPPAAATAIGNASGSGTPIATATGYETTLEATDATGAVMSDIFTS